MASCTQIECLMQAHIDGELRDAERVILEQHVGACAHCAAVLRQHQTNSALLFEVYGEYRLREGLRARVMAHLPEMEAPVAPHPPRIPRPSLGARIGALVPALAPAVLVVLALAMWAFWPRPELAGQPVGMVTQKVGQVSRIHDALPSRRNVELASVVMADEWLETGPGAGLVVAFAGNSELKLAENSRIKIFDERRVALEAGQALLRVGAQDAQLFRVTTSAGDVTVFGTLFHVAVKGNEALVTVAEGEVQVANDVAFTLVRPGEQVVLALAQKPLQTQPANVPAAMAWAEGLQADTVAQAKFAEKVRPRGTRVLRAEQVFVVTPESGDMDGVHAIRLVWEPDPFRSGHAGYDIYISDERMNPLLVHHVPALVFQDKDRQNYLLDLTEHEPVRTARVLHIRIVPNTSTGHIETVLEVEALG